MMPRRALRVSRYLPDAQADGRTRPALVTLPGPGVVLLALSLAGLGVALLGSTALVMLKGAVVLLALSLAGLGVAALLGSTVLVMLKGAVVLSFFFWIATVASRRYRHDSWARSDGGGIGYTVAVEVVRKPLLTLLVVLGLGLGVTGTVVSSIFLMLAILACVGVCIQLRKLAAGVRTIRQWRYVPRKGRSARASGALATRLRRSKRATGGSRPINNREHLLEADGPIEELRLFVRLSHRTDQDAAAGLAVQAMAAARETLGTPSPVCLSRSAADGSAVLELHFHVRDLRRGREHVLDEARSNIWDALNDHRIAFTFPPYEQRRPDAVPA
jgi:hypothetical protein